MPQSRYSLSFDGATGYVAAPSFNLDPDFTFAAWVRLDATGFYPMVMSYAAPGLTELRCQAGSRLPEMIEGSVSATSSTPLALGAWHHLCGTRTAAALNLYVDGVLAATAVPVGRSPSLSLLWIGARGGAALFFPGLIDDMLVYPGILTAPQIASLAAGTLNPATLTTSGLWRFEEGTGTTTADSSGNGNDGTLNGGVTWSSDVPIQLQGITFDAASNSGNKTSVSSFTWSHTCAGSDRFLAVDVAFGDLGTPTVTGVTYNSVAMTFLVAKSIAVGGTTVRVESWGLANPASGSNTVAVTLSGTAAVSLGMAVSYTDVNQAVPTEATSSASGLDAGAGVATVTVTTTADRDWVHAAIVEYGDDAITAGQTSRNNVSNPGVSSGADEDTGPVTPAGAQAMTYSAILIATSWAMTGYAIRSVLAVNFSFTRPFFVFQAVNAAATY